MHCAMWYMYRGCYVINAGMMDVVESTLGYKHSSYLIHALCFMPRITIGLEYRNLGRRLINTI